MTRSGSLLVLLSSIGAAMTAVGCADTATVYRGTGYTVGSAAPAHAPVAARSSAAAGASYQPVATAPACAPGAQAPCAPPPCAPPPPPCGLPCERGESEWHVRAVAGIPYMAGTDAGEGCFYWGADVGTTRCNCVGFDAFYRTQSCDDGSQISPLTSPTSVNASYAIPARFDRDQYGEDGGRIQYVGVKATYQTSIAGSNFYGYGGIGPEYFWTEKYLDNDSGFGGFAEAGIGWRFASWGSLRAGVDVHGDNTSVTRKSPADAGKDRLLWTIAPIVGLEFDF